MEEEKKAEDGYGIDESTPMQMEMAGIRNSVMRMGYRVHQLKPCPELEGLFRLIISADRTCMVWGDSTGNHCPQIGQDIKSPTNPESRAG
jgi:hypothetical protein